MAMNPEIKAEWLERLRSGAYPQVSGALCRVLEPNERPSEDMYLGYCCLGVLAEIAVSKGVIRRHENPVTGRIFIDNNNTTMVEKFVYEYEVVLGEDFSTSEPFSTMIDNRVADWAGIDPFSLFSYLASSDKVSEGLIGDALGALAEMNDKGISFNDIADLIEEYL